LLEQTMCDLAANQIQAGRHECLPWRRQGFRSGACAHQLLTRAAIRLPTSSCIRSCRMPLSALRLASR
jgi:hypothetical protein